MAMAATPVAVHRHRIAFLPAGHAGTEGRHPAGILMAEREAPRTGADSTVVQHMQVRVANPGPADLDQDLAGTNDRHRHLLDHGRPARPNKAQCLHRIHLLPSASARLMGIKKESAGRRPANLKVGDGGSTPPTEEKWFSGKQGPYFTQPPVTDMKWTTFGTSICSAKS